MRVRILGSGAGGGLPQWNCGCDHCRAARDGTPGVAPRHQSSLAVSADGIRWLLINASPDVRSQLASFAPMGPAPGKLRGSGLSAVALTNADIDHCAGLLVLREGGAPPIYGTTRVRTALTEGLSILPTLAAYGPVDFRETNLGRAFEVRDRAGTGIGVWVEPFAVASKPPPYMSTRHPVASRDDLAGDTVGLLLRPGPHARPVAAYVPGVRDLDDALAARLANAALILIDGTFFTDDELLAHGMSAKTAHAMGHAPLSGAAGTLAFLARFPAARRVLLHINNTNPIVREGSEARAAVERAGVEVGHDGMEFRLE